MMWRRGCGVVSGNMLFQMSVLNLDLHHTCRGYSSVAEHSTADREVTSSTLVAPWHIFSVSHPFLQWFCRSKNIPGMWGVKKLKERFWRGSNSRPSACKADVITTTPQNQTCILALWARRRSIYWNVYEHSDTHYAADKDSVAQR